MAKYTIREGKREDCKEIRRLIQELADFEKMPEGPEIGAEDLERDGFDVKPPLHHTFVAECTDNPGVLVGYALYYYVYSALTGRRLFLEDICVTEEHRGCGVGLALIKKVMEAVEANCCAMDCYVLDWNPAKNFYIKLGASDITTGMGLRVYRIKYPQMELAEYHNNPEGSKLSIEDLQREGFDVQYPLFHVYVAHIQGQPDVLLGYAFYHYTYGTWKGRKTFLRDLCVTKTHRGLGLGKALIGKVFEKAVEMNCKELDFLVSDWNKPSQQFYHTFGAVDISESEEWRVYKINRKEIDDFLSQ